MAHKAGCKTCSDMQESHDITWRDILQQITTGF